MHKKLSILIVIVKKDPMIFFKPYFHSLLLIFGVSIHKITTLKNIMRNKRLKNTSVHKYVNEISTCYWSHAILH